jgi:ferrous iron transport protein B
MHSDQKVKATNKKTPLISLVGQPNSGKTTLFNFLSGKNYKTVNYPGSTVEYSISKILSKYAIDANILDSPGIISLVPSSPDEKISVNSLHSHPEFGTPDLIIVTVDSSQLSRHLLLVKQLIDSGFNVVVALTMKDILHKKGFDVSEKRLSEMLGCSVVSIDGKTGKGIDNLLKTVNDNIHNGNSGKSISLLRLPHNQRRESLLESYREIESIEKEVLFSKNDNDNNTQVNIAKINEQLVVLNPSRTQNRPDEQSMKLDRVLLHKYFGLAIFALVMTITFTLIFWLAAPLMDLVNEGFSYASEVVVSLMGDTWYGNLISGGIISGVGSVLVFLPQIVLLFLILGLLEDSGYLARGAMIVDKPLSKIGLNGKSFVPMLSGFACAIPAIMATRTITNRRERFLTIFIVPLMSCSARLPVYALLIAFLFPPESPWLGGLALTAIYIFSIASSLIIASIVNKFSAKLSGDSGHSSFILELPAYRKPKFNVVVMKTLDNAMQYVKKAGPIILYLSIILWFLTYFPNHSPEINSSGKSSEEVAELTNSERIATSYASKLGKFIEPALTPIGMDWRVGVSLVATLAAREVFVSSLALTFKVTESGEDIQNSILNSMRNATIEGTDQKLFTTATSAGLIIFFVFALQCISTIAIVRKETGSWKMPVIQLVMFTGIAYVLTFITVNGLRLLGVN